jgi:prevent-host-death family protein
MKQTEWNIADAKSRLSEVLNRVDEQAPQIIRRRGKDYVLITGEQYRQLTGESPDFLDYLMNHGPKMDDLEVMPRVATPMREIDL